MKLLIAALTVLLAVAVIGTEKAALRLPDTDLKSGGKIATTIIKFPLLSRQPGKIPVLKARIFYEKENVGGWNYGLSLFLNVHKMGVKTYGGKTRLLRRSSPSAGKHRGWYRSGGWLVMYGPGRGETDDRILKTADGGWFYYFDISDLAKYTDTESEIRENHFQIASYIKLPLKLQDMEIVYMTETEADEKRKQ